MAESRPNCSHQTNRAATARTDGITATSLALSRALLRAEDTSIYNTRPYLTTFQW